MKRKTIMKAIAVMTAFTLMVGSTMSVFAAEKDGIGFNTDDWGNDGGTSEHVGDHGQLDWSWENQDSGSDSSSNDNYVEDTSNNQNTTVDNSGNTNSNESYAAEKNSAPNASTNFGSGNSGSSSSNTDSIQSAATAKISRGNNGTLTVPGYETARHSSKATAGTYTVMHKGIEVTVFQLADENGNTVGYKEASVGAMADGRYALNITLLDNADASKVSLTVFKGDAAYLPTLGIMAVTVNGTVVKDMQAEMEAAAK